MPLTSLKKHFNKHTLKTKGLTLLIEHSPCCLLSLAAGLVGLPGLRHNPLIELGFAIAGALVGEYLGHRMFHKHDKPHAPATVQQTLRRYGLSLLFGLSSWGLHQKLFHHHHEHGHEPAKIQAAAPKPKITAANAVFFTAPGAAAR